MRAGGPSLSLRAIRSFTWRFGPAPPPYLRRTSTHEVHAILSECHWLARDVLVGDTS